jgi:uncharacterized protein YqgC (DUF456 family)
MDYASILAIALIVMLIGLLGTLLPGIPGVPLIWLALTGFAVLDRFQHFSLLQFLFLTMIAGIGSSAEWWGTQIFIRAGGGSTWSAVAGTCLMAIGLFFFTLPTAVLIALAGVFGVEWRRGRDPMRAGLSSVGWLIGWVLSLIVEVAMAIVIILLFVQWVIPSAPT